MAHPELKALADVLGDLEPTAPTACADWTVHDLVAHLAAGAKEVAELIEEYLAGQPARPTRGFDERERPFRAFTHPDLLAALAEQSRRKIAALEVLAGRGDRPAVAFTGTTMTATQFQKHARSEAALHRWDLVGDDSVCDQLLSQPDLTRHAVNVLNAMPVLDESARIRQSPAPRRIVLTSSGQPDVVIETGTAGARFALVEVEDRDGPAKGDIVVATDAANRLLVLWGRRSSQRQLSIETDGVGFEAIEPVLWPAATTWPRHDSQDTA
ncbi:MAG TPA: maleylpyruvate isomerase N-terminal domain-containing protein [Acidimicrobiales bacterium]|nr:maleylpyruvate isomerase N-terminal domain-containing protein [Acidimicrobiales bacterium]